MCMRAEAAAEVQAERALAQGLSRGFHDEDARLACGVLLLLQRPPS
jgi:hypothetical protein